MVVRFTSCPAVRAARLPFRLRSSRSVCVKYDGNISTACGPAGLLLWISFRSGNPGLVLGRSRGYATGRTDGSRRRGGADRVFRIAGSSYKEKVTRSFSVLIGCYRGALRKRPEVGERNFRAAGRCSVATAGHLAVVPVENLI